MSVDVEQLVADHKKAISTIDGIEFHSVPSLISQLREAIFGGMEHTGGSAPGSRLPISAGALDLYQVVDRQITEAWVGVFHRPPNADRPERLLAEWAAHVQPDTPTEVGGKLFHADAFVGRLVQRVEDFFNPPRTAEILAPCIACGERYVTTDDTQTSALRFHRDRTTNNTTSVTCAACDTTWTPPQFEHLAAAIGIDVHARKQEYAETTNQENRRQINER